MEFVLTLVFVIGAVLLLDARSRLKRVERRLQELERAPRPAVPRGAAAMAAPAMAAPEPAAPAGPETATEPLAPPAAEMPVVEMPAVAMSVIQAAPALQPSPASPPAAPAPRQGLAINFEELFGRRLPIWAGGITLAIAGVLIVKYAIDIGLFARIFTPGVQVACGLLFGLGLIGGAELAHARRVAVDDPRVAQALSGAGISTLYAAVLVAANAYHLVSPLTAFLGLALVTVLALALSLRHGAPSALLGLAGGLAAPALTVGIAENVPMLAVYLGFTVAGLVGVSRAQRWPWLALVALVGGAGWSLWLILAGAALGTLGSLSVGGFVVLLAIAAPLFAFDGARATLLRTAAALVGALQLALLVALGGFAPLDWGLFALIAAAGQWLAWREPQFAVVPTIGAALSALLLLIWPAPEAGWLLAIGLALAAIHAVPLVARLWREPARVQRAVELAAIALAAPLVALRHAAEPLAGHDPAVALTAALAAAGLALAAALGWQVEGRRGDGRFGWLVAAAGLLGLAAAWFAVPHWQAPLWAAAVAALVTLLARPAGDARLEGIAAGFVIGGTVLLAATGDWPFAEWQHLAGRGADLPAPFALPRWAALAAAAAVLAALARQRTSRTIGEIAAAALAYGALAQVLPGGALPLVAPAGCLALAAAAGRRRDWPRLAAAMLTLVAITAAWGFLPLAVWLDGAARSLAGIPMLFGRPELAPGEVARRLFAPALLLGASLWLLRTRLPARAALAAGLIAGIPALVALHGFYRAGFANLFGSDFAATGLAQRLVWDALILAAAAALWKRAGGLLASHAAPVLVGIAAFHAAWYSLLLHNPLWTAQAVGPVPAANLLLPLFAVLPLSIWLLGRMVPAIARHADRALQPVAMAMIALLAWASLRQAFHGSLLTVPGVGAGEDILRSILGIALALGFLLHGIRARRHDWRLASLVLMLAAVAKVFLFDASGLEGLLRIASFVALGFSLIGIGWLYSRQLRRENGPEPATEAGREPAAQGR
jgi:uncharacterized membrane protein